jgi:hypothetical protein
MRYRKEGNRIEGGRKEFVKNRTVAIFLKKGGNKMVRKQLFIGLVGLFICGFIFMGSAMHAAAQNTLKIGVIWGLSGPGSQMQALMRDSAVLAVEWINSKGGITVGGQKVLLQNLCIGIRSSLLPGWLSLSNLKQYKRFQNRIK